MRRPLKRAAVSRPVSQPARNGLAGGTIVPTTDSPWVERLLMLHLQVRHAVAKTGRLGLIAASSRELCDEIVKVLGDEGY